MAYKFCIILVLFLVKHTIGSTIVTHHEIHIGPHGEKTEHKWTETSGDAVEMGNVPMAAVYSPVITVTQGFFNNIPDPNFVNGENLEPNMGQHTTGLIMPVLPNYEYTRPELNWLDLFLGNTHKSEAAVPVAAAEVEQIDTTTKKWEEWEVDEGNGDDEEESQIEKEVSETPIKHMEPVSHKEFEQKFVEKLPEIEADNAKEIIATTPKILCTSTPTNNETVTSPVIKQNEPEATNEPHKQVHSIDLDSLPAITVVNGQQANDATFLNKIMQDAGTHLQKLPNFGEAPKSPMETIAKNQLLKSNTAEIERHEPFSSSELNIAERKGPIFIDASNESERQGPFLIHDHVDKNMVPNIMPNHDSNMKPNIYNQHPPIVYTFGATYYNTPHMETPNTANHFNTAYDDALFLPQETKFFTNNIPNIKTFYDNDGNDEVDTRSPNVGSVYANPDDDFMPEFYPKRAGISTSTAKPLSNIALYLKQHKLRPEDLLAKPGRTITKTIVDDNGDVLTVTFVLSSIKDEQKVLKTTPKPIK